MALCSGIVDDLQRRAPHYLSDWHYDDFDCLKTLSASFYMFFNSLVPAITFGMLLSDSTRYQMGVLEVLMEWQHQSVVVLSAFLQDNL